MEPDSRGPLRVCLLTDSFPPRAGGSGWSTYYLAKALQARGHDVLVLRPVFASSGSSATLRLSTFGGLDVEEIGVPEPGGLASKAGFAGAIRTRRARRGLARRALELARDGGFDVLHGQHSISAIAAAQAAATARKAGHRPVAIATVRDYWPLCPSSTRLFRDGAGRDFECRDCHGLPSYMRCVLSGRSGLRRAAMFLPAVARWLQTARLAAILSDCQRVVAVSRYVAQELTRSNRVPRSKVTVIPNMVDLHSVDAALSGCWPLPDLAEGARFVLFAGKLDVNKGALLLVDVMAHSSVGLPLVVAGDGPLRARLETDALDRGLDFRFYDWLDNDAVLRLMHAASAVLFPSAWQEPLSRVCLEACAAGSAVAAMDTGGAPDIFTDGENALLVQGPTDLARALARLVSDGELNSALRRNARATAASKFSADVVCAEVEAMYYSALWEGYRK